MRYIVTTALVLGLATTSRAGELDKEMRRATTSVGVPALASPAATATTTATEMDQEAIQQAWRRWGFWGAYRPWGFAYAAPVGYYPSVYVPAVRYASFVSYGYNYGWGGFYRPWYGYRTFAPGWGFWGW